MYAPCVKQEKAKDLHDAGFTVFAIGAGGAFNNMSHWYDHEGMTDLKAIASDPVANVYETYHIATEILQLEDVQGAIHNSLCEVMKITGEIVKL